MERKVKDIMFAKYMEKHIWDEFEGKIVWIIAKWIFVELENTIEWFIAIDWKNSIFDEEMINLKVWEKKYELWNKIKIKVIWVDKLRWQIDFEEIKN
jgi:ribonuclease R